MITIRNVHRRYRAGGADVHALRGIDLEIAAGTVTAIFGRSGSGKTTLLNCIGSLDRPDDGEIEVGETVVTDLRIEQAARWRRATLGFVYQANGLMPWLTAQHNVELPLRMAGGRSRTRKHRAAESLGAVGLGDWANHLPDQLSGGQQQRVSIAQVTVTKPALLLADEPTGALDEATGREILRLFADAAASFGCTVLIATHDEATAQIADRVIELGDGAVIDREQAGR